jgi:hypothetical protein
LYDAGMAQSITGTSRDLTGMCNELQTAAGVAVERQDAQVTGIMSNLDFASLEIAEQTQRAVAEMGHTRLTEVHRCHKWHGDDAMQTVAPCQRLGRTFGLAWSSDRCLIGCCSVDFAAFRHVHATGAGAHHPAVAAGARCAGCCQDWLWQNPGDSPGC